jgi:hypothetical protein
MSGFLWSLIIIAVDVVALWGLCARVPAKSMIA